MAGIDYGRLFAPAVPTGAARWSGFPRYNFIGGHTDPEIIPVDGLVESATRALHRKGRALSTYHMDSGPQGLIELREFLVEKLVRFRGIHLTPEEVMITSGSNQGIHLVNQLLLEAGDTVIAEAFTYQGALNEWRRRGVNVVGVPLDREGMRLDHLATTLEDLRSRGIVPKYVYTIPTVQNPTGTVLGMDRRRELLDLSRSYGVPIFEDECYADLLWEGEWPHAIRALDEANHVIHIGSFSKCLAPALRLGYAVAGWEVMSRLLAAKTDGGTGALAQLVVADFFQEHYEAHVGQLKTGLKRKLDALVAALDQHFVTAAEFERPKGGIFLWVKLPAAVDTAKLAQPALNAGVAFNPGPDWSADPAAGRHHLRLCCAQASEEEIAAGIARLAEVCHRETGVPERGANVAQA